MWYLRKTLFSEKRFVYKRVHAPVFSNNSLNNLWSSKCFYYIDAGSLHKCLFVPLPALSLYSFDQLDRLVFLWQIAVWVNWFLNIFLGKRRQGISRPLLSYVTNKLEPLPMFYGWTVEHRQGSTISDPYESRSGGRSETPYGHENRYIKSIRQSCKWCISKRAQARQANNVLRQRIEWALESQD